ncbi:MAG: hypothetical protein LAP13_11585 [Acidobacteriia bacterium]|nr:hypothetical protein [Terriglobia bacterium]
MSELEITLKDVFPTAARGLAKSMMAVLASCSSTRQLQEHLLNQVKGVQWAWVLKEIWCKIPELLDVKLVNVLSGAFNKAREFEKYTDPKKYPPDQVILADLAEHTLKSEHHPYVEVLLNDQPVGRLVFDVAVALVLKGLVLKIQNARIKAISPGSCQAKGSIALEKAVLVERALTPLTLPGFIDLGEGISLKQQTRQPLSQSAAARSR